MNYNKYCTYLGTVFSFGELLKVTFSCGDIRLFADRQGITVGGFGIAEATFEISDELKASCKRQKGRMTITLTGSVAEPFDTFYNRAEMLDSISNSIEPVATQVHHAATSYRNGHSVSPPLASPVFTLNDRQATVTTVFSYTPKGIAVGEIHAMFDFTLVLKRGIGTSAEYFEKLNSALGCLPALKLRAGDDVIYILFSGSVVYNRDLEEFSFSAGESMAFITKDIDALTPCLVKRLPKDRFNSKSLTLERSKAGGLRRIALEEIENRTSSVGGLYIGDSRSRSRYFRGETCKSVSLTSEMLSYMKLITALKDRRSADRLLDFILYLHKRYKRIPHACTPSGDNAELTLNVYEPAVIAAADAVIRYNSTFGMPRREISVAVTEELCTMARLSCHGMMPVSPYDTSYLKANYMSDARFHGSKATTLEFMACLEAFIPIADKRRADSLEASLTAAKKFFGLNFCEGNYMPYRARLIKKPHKVSGCCDRCKSFALLTAYRKRYLCTSCSEIVKKLISKIKTEKIYERYN